MHLQVGGRHGNVRQHAPPGRVIATGAQGQGPSLHVERVRLEDPKVCVDCLVGSGQNGLCPTSTLDPLLRPWTAFQKDWPLRAGLPQHPFLQLPGLSRASVCLDVLHLVDLGVAGVIIGGTLKWLWQTAANPEEQLQELWGLCQQGYQETRTQQRLDRLPKAMFLKEPVSTQWPVWRAKGAVTRHFAPALLYGVTRLGLPMAPFFQLVLQALMGLVGFYKELEAWRNLQVLSPPVASALQRHIGQLQGALMKLALEQTQLWFNVTPSPTT